MTRLSRNSKILVLHPGALGDGLLSLPTLRRLRRYYSKHDLIWIGHRALGEVFINAGEIHEAFSFDSIQVGKVLRRDWSLHQCLKARDSTLDLVFGWLDDEDGYWKTWAENLGCARSIFRSPHGPQCTSRHMSDRYAEVMEEDSLIKCPSPVQDIFHPLDGTFPKFNMPCRTHLRASPEDKIQFLLHPGSGSPNKCVEPHVFSGMARKLIARFPDRVFFIGGPADTKYLDPVLAMLTDLHPRCFQRLDLLGVCGLLQEVNVYIGHDSGLSHLAANLGVPSLLLFGPTDPAVWAPRGSHIHVQRNLNLHFSSDDLCDAAEQLLQNCQRPLVG